MKPLMPPPTIDETKFEIEYHIGYDPYPQQQDAIFYTGMDCIATVKYEGFVVDVYCDGETRANLLNEPNGEVVFPLYLLQISLEQDLTQTKH